MSLVLERKVDRVSGLSASPCALHVPYHRGYVGRDHFHTVCMAGKLFLGSKIDPLMHIPHGTTFLEIQRAISSGGEPAACVACGVSSNLELALLTTLRMLTDTCWKQEFALMPPHVHPMEA